MFYQILRIYLTDTFHNSVQYFYLADYESVDAMMIAVQARYHNILAADLQNADCTYNAAYIIDNAGNTFEKAVFDRRPAETPEETEEAAAE